jgi:hypothetical protein
MSRTFRLSGGWAGTSNPAWNEQFLLTRRDVVRIPVRVKLCFSQRVIHIAALTRPECQWVPVASEMTNKRPLRPLQSEKALEV